MIRHLAMLAAASLGCLLGACRSAPETAQLQDRLLAPVLGIDDPRTNARVDFVGGIRGHKELERRCQKDCVAAIAMHPISVTELMDVADADLIMPPKSSWFEPKPRSGFVVRVF